MQQQLPPKAQQTKPGQHSAALSFLGLWLNLSGQSLLPWERVFRLHCKGIELE